MQPPVDPIHYGVQPHRPEAHLFKVICRVPQPDPGGQRLFMPAWIPGSYLVRDFARNVVSLTAESAGESVPVSRYDKSTWKCGPCGGPLRIEYEVYAWDLSVRGAHLDSTHGYFNGTCLFLQPLGHEPKPCTVELEPPPGEAFSNWRVATSMERLDADPHGFGTYRADSYEELIDHPVELGQFVSGYFTACGVPHEVAITGRHRADMSRLCADLATLCEHHIRFFGEPPPMKRYLFQVTAVGEGYGGLEHRASTSLLCSRSDLPKQGDRSLSEGYRTFLGLCSHEYFHSWNVKRIKPEAFSPYRLDREVHTRQLWVFEGITSYYDDLALRRCGLITREAYLELLAQTATRVQRGYGRFRQSIADSSFDAWTRFYKQDENSPNAIVSYYAKGSLVALALDLLLRRDTSGLCSLDTLMSLLWKRHGESEVGLPEGGFERLAEEVSGLQLGAFFGDAVYGTAELPLSDLLRGVGVELAWRAAEGLADKGGKAKSGIAGPYLGIRLAADSCGARVEQVLEGGPAQAAGIAAGDLIIAVDGLRVGRDNLLDLLQMMTAGEPASVHVFRRDELMSFDLIIGEPVPDTVALSLIDPVPPEVAARRDAWLGKP